MAMPTLNSFMAPDPLAAISTPQAPALVAYNAGGKGLAIQQPQPAPIDATTWSNAMTGNVTTPDAPGDPMQNAMTKSVVAAGKNLLQGAQAKAAAPQGKTPTVYGFGAPGIGAPAAPVVATPRQEFQARAAALPLFQAKFLLEALHEANADPAKRELLGLSNQQAEAGAAAAQRAATPEAQLAALSTTRESLKNALMIQTGAVPGALQSIGLPAPTP